MNEKNHKNETISKNPKIIWAENKKISERKPPNEKIIYYCLESETKKKK